MIANTNTSAAETLVPSAPDDEAVDVDPRPK
jgi:hypothetical protein